MTGPRLTRILATSALATTLAGSIVTSSQAMPLPVTSAHEIAGATPTDHVQWWGWRRPWGWGGYGWGWRRPYYGGGALAAGLIGGLALGTLAASAGSYYGYGYPAYGYGYSYYPSSYAYPSYSYPGYYRTAYYGTSYGWGYGSAYWASGKRVQKHARKPVRR
jgi:hypothetical protein